jgi:hypothetical protein
MHDFLHTARRLIATALHPAAHSEMQRLLSKCSAYFPYSEFRATNILFFRIIGPLIMQPTTPRAEREEQRKAASERRKPALAVAHPRGDGAFSPASY